MHHRQPLLLDECQTTEWIQGKHEIERKKDNQVQVYEVSKNVNSPRNDNPELLEKS